MFSTPVTGDHIMSQQLPSRLPPLDVSPVSLGFSAGRMSPTSSPLRNNTTVDTRIYRTQPGDISSGVRSSVKTQSRPVITVSVPAIPDDVEADSEVFASPRSAPTPPTRPSRGAHHGMSPSISTAGTPASPMRFPIPPTENNSVITSHSDRSLNNPELNSGFSFPPKDAGFITRGRGNRGASVDMLSTRVQDQRTPRNQIVSSPSRPKLQGESRMPFISSDNTSNYKPPMIPLPAPPSTFSVDSEDQAIQSSSAISIPTIPSLASCNSLVLLQSRSSGSISMTPSTGSTPRDTRVEEKTQEHIGKARFEHVPKQSVAEMKELHLLRVETNAQRTRYDDLATKVVVLMERHDRERDEMCRRIDALEEEAKYMEEDIKKLTLARGSGDGTTNGLLETPASTMDGIDDFLMTPDVDTGSPSSPFDHAHRLLTAAPKEKMLRRSNTMPEGFDAMDGTGRRPSTSGKKISKRGSAWLLATAGLRPKFSGSGANITNASLPGRGLGLDCALPDSPMIREGASVSVERVSGSYSVPALNTSGTSKLSNLTVRPSLLVRPRGGKARGGQVPTPDMEEILAKLRSFESHSPAFR